ncbi:MAG: hypothetical protein RL033_4342 [Pseudomonadota bacterium]|jgi:hypothetical protein
MNLARSLGAACCLVFACGDSVSPGAVTASLEADPLQQALRGEQVTEPHLVKTRGPAHEPEDGRPSSSSHDGQDRDGQDRNRHDRDGHPHGHEPEEPSSTACGAALWLEEIAADDSDWHIGSAPPALDNAGSLAFAAADAADAPHLLLVSDGVFTAVELASSELTLPSRVGLDDAGNLAFVAGTTTSDRLFGVFSTDAQGSDIKVHYAAEVGGGRGDEGSIITGLAFALAPNGTLAFGSIRDGKGALYRGEVGGDVEVVRTGAPGTFFNEANLDVNAAGTVALQMEHGGACGLRRGILLFDEPNPELVDVDKAIDGLFVGQQPDAAINDGGVIALALQGEAPTTEVLRCPSGEPSERVDVATGVYTATATPLSDRPELTLVADNSDAFASFGSVDIDAEGRVVFEAVLASGERGIFSGPDAEQDKIVAVGDELNGEVVTEVQLGQLNDACQLSFATVSASGRRVWRAEGIAH